MYSAIIQYLTGKIESLNAISKVYGLGNIVSYNGEEYPSVVSNGENVHVNFDLFKSLSFILKNGNVSRTTDEHPFLANAEKVTQVYPLRLIIYSQNTENENCESLSPQIADYISAQLSGYQSLFVSELGLDGSKITVTSKNTDKYAVWEELYSVEHRLKEQDVLISIDFEFEVSGDETCFTTAPCETYEFSFDFGRTTFCEKVDNCLSIPTDDGQYVLEITDGVKSWSEYSPTGLTDGNGTTINGNKVDLGGDLTQDTTLNVDDYLLEFTTAYGHNLIFTDDFLSQGINFTGIYHNNSGVIFFSGISDDQSGNEYAQMSVFDNVNNKQSSIVATDTFSQVSFTPDTAQPFNVNIFKINNSNSELSSSDNDGDEYNLKLSYCNGDGTTTQVGGVYRDGAIATDTAFYIGDKTTDGSWRITLSSGDLVIEKRVAGVWVTKQTLI